MNKPSHFHIGYGRSGSTWIQREIFKKNNKNINFIRSREWLIKRAKKSSDLKNAYPNFKSNSVVLESEEGLIGDEFRDHYELAKKIYWINPKAKILICIRSQYSIIKSFYYLYIKKGGIDSFEEYLETIINNKKFNYWKIYKTYVKKFGKKNIKIVFFEDLINEPNCFVTQINSWLGVKTIDFKFDISRNKNQSYDYIYIEVLRILNIFLGISKLPRGNNDKVSNEFRKKIKLRKLLFSFLSIIIKPIKFFKLSKKLEFNNKFLKKIKKFYHANNNLIFQELCEKKNRKYYP